MTARVAVVALMLFTAALLQTALFPYVTIVGYRPDMLLLLTTLFALRDGALTGVRVGFAAGILADVLLQQSALGLSALVFVGVGYSVGTVRPYLAPESITAPLLLASTAGVLGTLGYGLLVALLGEQAVTTRGLVEASIVVGLYNTVLAPGVDAAVRGLRRQFPVETRPQASLR